MHYGTKADCALIIDGEEMFHEAVHEGICHPEDSCCIHIKDFNDFKPESIFDFDPRPDIIFLRISSEKSDAIRVLKMLKNADDVKYIPLVAVVDANNNQLVKDAYAHFANCCIEMDNDTHELARRITQVWDFWQEIAQLPPHVIPRL